MRAYVFDSYNRRFEELLDSINSVAFMKMDQRLMKYLLDKQQNTGVLLLMKPTRKSQRLKYQSCGGFKLLKQLEREDKIELHRNRIEIL